jgi:hypothetical protein
MGKTGVKGRAAPACAMRIDQLFHFGGDTLALERFDHQAALPCVIERSRHMLRGASTTSSEPATDRRRALGRRVERLDKLRTLSLKFDPRPFAGQSVGNDRPVRRHALPMRIERDDGNFFKRLSHGARR